MRVGFGFDGWMQDYILLKCPPGSYLEKEDFGLPYYMRPICKQRRIDAGSENGHFIKNALRNM